jgi:hypothetical protein
LLNDLEVLRQQTQSAKSARIGFQMLSDAGRHFGVFLHEEVDHCWRDWRAQDLGMSQRAG